MSALHHSTSRSRGDQDPAARQQLAEASQLDVHFRRFFRIDGGEAANEAKQKAGGHVTLDCLSLLACERQGVNIMSELLPKPLEAFADTSSPSLVVESRAESFETRRQQKLRLLEIERKRITGILLSIHPSFYDTSDDARAGARSSSHGSRRGRAEKPVMTFDQQLLVTELTAQAEHMSQGSKKVRPPYSASFLVPNERSVAMPLLTKASASSGDAQDVSQKAVQKLQEQGSIELEKLKRRELRGVEREIDVELTKMELLQHVQQKEAQLAEQKQRRRDEAARRALEQDLERQRKVAEIHRHHQQLMRERQQLLEERSKYRDEHLSELERKKEEEALERQRAQERVQEEARERARLLLEDREAKRMLLREEVRSRMALHTQRKHNIELRMSTVREMRRLDELRKFARVSEFLSNDGAENTKLAERVEEEEEAARLRQLERQARMHETAELQKFETKEQLELAHQRRLELDAERNEKAERLLMALSEQEEHVRMVQDAKRAERELRAELVRQRENNHVDNLDRLNKTYEYRLEMKQRRVEQERARMETQSKAKKELEQSLHLARLAMARDREILLEQVTKLSSSPNFFKTSVSTTSSESADRHASRQSIVQKLQLSLENARRPTSRPLSSSSPATRERLAIADRPNSSPTQRPHPSKPTTAAASSRTAAHEISASLVQESSTTPVTLVTGYMRPADDSSMSSM